MLTNETTTTKTVDYKYFFAAGNHRFLRHEIEYVTIEMRGRGEDKTYAARVEVTNQKQAIVIEGDNALLFAKWWGFPILA